jgi:hypothetical protein
VIATIAKAFASYRSDSDIRITNTAGANGHMDDELDMIASNRRQKLIGCYRHTIDKRIVLKQAKEWGFVIARQAFSRNFVKMPRHT